MKLDYAERTLKKKIEENYKLIDRIPNVANSVNIWIRLKETLQNKVEYCGNNMNLINITEETLIDTIKDVYEQRKDIYINENNDTEYSYDTD